MSNVWEVLGAFAGIFSFAFAVYEYYKSKSERNTEKAKVEIYKQRLADLHTQLISTMHSIDAIIQIGKQEQASVAMLQNIARIARGNLYVNIKKLEKEREYLKSWRYGELVESQDEIEKVDEESIDKK